MDRNEKLKHLPKTDRLMAKFEGFNQNLLKTAIRTTLDSIRESAGDIPPEETIMARVRTEYERLRRGTLYKVINATGVPIHTNLGRSPIAEDVLKEAFGIASGYSNLEYDTARGKRGDRYHHAAEYLRILTDAEDAIVVNNNASAVFLILNTFAKSKEVIVSRGELVEIGGSFRIPDVMKGSGAKLAEIGTTNKTRIADYEDAVNGKTAMMMKVHRSNYAIQGFTEEAEFSEITSAAAKAGVISYYDAGSGLFTKILPESVCADITIPEVIKKGFDLVSFSGDKMLGGPQAGIIAGKKELIQKLKKNQLMRMLRVDKITLALLQAVFRKYIEGTAGELPVNRMLSANPRELKAKAEKLAKMLPCKADIIETSSSIGGGSCPASEIASYGVSPVTGKKPQAAERLLRMNSVPVVARVSDDRLILDVRTIDEADFESVASAVKGLL